MNWKGERFLSETLEYERVKKAKDEAKVSYAAMMIRIILVRFNLDKSNVKVALSLANKPMKNTLNNISFIFFDFKPDMTPDEIDKAVNENAWQAPVVSAMLHNVPKEPAKYNPDEPPRSSDLADICISLVPGQKENIGTLFDAALGAYVFNHDTAMPLYICCIRYGDSISMGASFSKSVMDAKPEPEPEGSPVPESPRKSVLDHVADGAESLKKGVGSVGKNMSEMATKAGENWSWSKVKETFIPPPKAVNDELVTPEQGTHAQRSRAVSEAFWEKLEAVPKALGSFTARRNSADSKEAAKETSTTTY